MARRRRVMAQRASRRSSGQRFWSSADDYRLSIVRPIFGKGIGAFANRPFHLTDECAAGMDAVFRYAMGVSGYPGGDHRDEKIDAAAELALVLANRLYGGEVVGDALERLKPRWLGWHGGRHHSRR